jgi:hypothetical protein
MRVRPVRRLGLIMVPPPSVVVDHGVGLCQGSGAHAASFRLISLQHLARCETFNHFVMIRPWPTAWSSAGVTPVRPDEGQHCW